MVIIIPSRFRLGDCITNTVFVCNTPYPKNIKKERPQGDMTLHLRRPILSISYLSVKIDGASRLCVRIFSILLIRMDANHII